MFGNECVIVPQGETTLSCKNVVIKEKDMLQTTTNY